jgi:hexulose-6-phosphate isomerase
MAPGDGTRIERRRFLHGALAAVAAAALMTDGNTGTRAMAENQTTETGPAGGKAGAGIPRLQKALIYDMLPAALAMEDRFRLARDTGFTGVEVSPVNDAGEAKKMRAAAEKAGVRIHSVIYGGWDAPLSHPDPDVAARGARAVEAALHSAQNLGADAILLVPAVVNAQTPYRDAYERSQKRVRELIPVAERLKVHLLIEEVWNNFLLSP